MLFVKSPLLYMLCGSPKLSLFACSHPIRRDNVPSNRYVDLATAPSLLDGGVYDGYIVQQ